MKYILVFLFCINTCFGQKKGKWERIGLLTTSVILNGIGDGLHDDGHKLAGKAFKAGSILSLLSIPLVAPTTNRRESVILLVNYALVRYTFFDPAYNLTRKLPFNYVGTTSFVDKAVANLPPDVRIGSRIFTLSFVITLE